MIGPLSFSRGQEISETQDWVDPFIGLRTSADVPPSWTFTAEGNTGWLEVDC